MLLWCSPSSRETTEFIFSFRVYPAQMEKMANLDSLDPPAPLVPLVLEE